MGSFGLQHPRSMEMFSPDMSWSWNTFLPFEDTSPYLGEGIPQFLWGPEQDLAGDMGSGGAVPPRELDGRISDSRSLAGTRSATHPYSNCPFVYRFKKGPVVKVFRLTEFLHSQSAWKQVNDANASSDLSKSSLPRIAEPVRDAIAARIHGMLSKLAERDSARLIPHLFPPLQTIQSFFRAYQSTFAAIYPIVHPTTYSESSWDSNEPYADIGIFLTALMVLGCLTTPVEEARTFSAELGYLIRHTINESATQDEAHLMHKWVVGAWIMNTLYSAWSGMKRHMELADAFQGIPSAVCSPSRINSSGLTFRAVFPSTRLLQGSTRPKCPRREEHFRFMVVVD